jgi:hypothetical protein
MGFYEINGISTWLQQVPDTHHQYMQARQSHCDNLIRIQKTVSSKIKQVLANIL